MTEDGDAPSLRSMPYGPTATEQIWLIGALSPALTIPRLTSTDSAIWLYASI